MNASDFDDLMRKIDGVFDHLREAFHEMPAEQAAAAEMCISGHIIMTYAKIGADHDPRVVELCARIENAMAKKMKEEGVA